MNQNKRERLWQPYQQEMWTQMWRKNPYTLQEMVDDNRWVGVKYSPLLSYVLKYARKDERVLEAGCGMGQWVIYLAELGYKITGLDFSLPTVKMIHKLYPDLDFVYGDVTDFEYPDCTFGAILSWGVMEHFEAGPQKVLSEAYRILKHGGVLFVTVPCDHYLFRFSMPLLRLKRALGRTKLVRRFTGNPYNQTKFTEHRFTKRQFLNHTIAVGFRVAELHPVNPERGLAVWARLMLSYHGRKGKTFEKSSSERWEGLTLWGSLLSWALNTVSPWMTPDQIFIVVIKP